MATKKIKRTLFLFISIICLIVGVFYVVLSSVRLEKIGYRVNDYNLSQTYKDIIKSECNGISETEKLIDRCNEIVCEQLKFTYRNDINNGEANCVGYAKPHAAALNYAFKMNNLPYKARPVYGKAFLWGKDLHPIFKAIVPKKYESFFNDHDYTEIDLGDEYLYVDTSIQDLLTYKYSAKQPK